jgi:dipeptidase E
MATIIAIGGAEVGELRADGSLAPVSVDNVHREILARTGKKHPKVLYIPTAKDDSEGFIAGFTQYYLSLGCSEVEVLRLIREKPSQAEMQAKIFSADIIYVNGGNTHRLLRLWKKRGVDTLIKQAYHRGIVMSGHSAGAVCWFEQGNSDPFGKHRPFRLKGLGLIPAVLCPHYDTEPFRQPAMKKMMKHTPHLMGIDLDETASIEIVDGKYRVIISTPTAKARRTYWKDGQFIIEDLTATKEFQDLRKLLTKPA